MPSHASYAVIETSCWRGGWKQHPNDPAEQRGIDKLKVIELSNWGADAGIDIPIDTLGQYPELNPKTASGLDGLQLVFGPNTIALR
ncbi:hypothetical protein [Bradyrhizobium sp. WSM1417]|uniref:hypothetical protein n=1 Tax=Bradyrhizobium sp. WSM1417 TaxID=754500 RepID=UPI00047F5714|nr:hypothetical protein [Bradyrhizobium sp. WSM1417]